MNNEKIRRDLKLYPKWVKFGIKLGIYEPTINQGGYKIRSILFTNVNINVPDGDISDNTVLSIPDTSVLEYYYERYICDIYYGDDGGDKVALSYWTKDAGGKIPATSVSAKEAFDLREEKLSGFGTRNHPL